MAKVTKDETEKIVEVQLDTPVDANHPDAVQIPDGVEDPGHPLRAHDEPSPEEVFAAAAKKPSGKAVDKVEDKK